MAPLTSGSSGVSVDSIAASLKPAVVLAQTRNPSQKMTARTRRAPDTLTRRRERIAGIDGLSIDTIKLYERNMIDELAPRLIHGELPVGS
jgi:hypothetical protein